MATRITLDNGTKNGAPSGPFSGGLPVGCLLPQGIVLQRLLDSFLDLFCGQTGIGTGELFPTFSHEGHGVKRLLLHRFTLLKRFIAKSTAFSARGEEGVYRIVGLGGDGGFGRSGRPGDLGRLALAISPLVPVRR